MSIHFHSSVLASAFGVALLGSVLTGSTVTVPNEAGRKGDMLSVASECGQTCTNALTRLTHYETDVGVDYDSGVITIERERIGN